MDNFWKEKWQRNDIRFHRDKAHPFLDRFLPRPQGHVFLPLCGKSLDLLWFANKGLKVTGVELSPLACESFFKENKLDFTLTQVGKFALYQSHQLSLYCGDFFEFQNDLEFDLIYDRAALIALPLDLRKKYYTKIKQLNFKQYFLISVDFEGEGGPPFPVKSQEISQQFESIKLIKQEFVEGSEKLSSLYLWEKI